MRALAIALVIALGLSTASEGKAAGRDVGPTARFGGGSIYDDGPYYITPWGEGFYAECGRPRVPYREDAYGPNPNTTFLGPVGYRCILGTYAIDPFYPPRCRTAFIRTPRGWQRERHCY